jgi:hypothetical protein
MKFQQHSTVKMQPSLDEAFKCEHSAATSITDRSDAAVEKKQRVSNAHKKKKFRFATMQISILKRFFKSLRLHDMTFDGRNVSSDTSQLEVTPAPPDILSQEEGKEFERVLQDGSVQSFQYGNIIVAHDEESTEDVDPLECVSSLSSST